MDEPISPEVMLFAKAMQHKLDVNKDKPGFGNNGNGRDWKQCELDYLEDRLSEENSEFRDELIKLDDDNPSENLLYEAADAANIMMFICHKCGLLKEQNQ